MFELCSPKQKLVLALLHFYSESRCNTTRSLTSQTGHLLVCAARHIGCRQPVHIPNMLKWLHSSFSALASCL